MQAHGERQVGRGEKPRHSCGGHFFGGKEDNLPAGVHGLADARDGLEVVFQRSLPLVERHKEHPVLRMRVQESIQSLGHGLVGVGCGRGLPPQARADDQPRAVALLGGEELPRVFDLRTEGDGRVGRQVHAFGRHTQFQQQLQRSPVAHRVVVGEVV